MRLSVLNPVGDKKSRGSPWGSPHGDSRDFFPPTGTYGINFIIDSMDRRGLTGFFSTHGDSRDILYNRFYGPTGTHGIFFDPRGLTGYTL